MRALFRHDLVSGTVNRMDAEPGHALEEAIFVPKPGKVAEEEGWLLHQRFSAARNESYLDIRDAATLEQEALEVPVGRPSIPARFRFCDDLGGSRGQ
jgi:all-trans-8'-apo-beta-carotenal 15,15'-oxygenase